MPHPSFSTSRNFGSVFNRVFNLIQSALSDLPGSFHGNAAKHQKFDTNRWKTPVLFSIASIKFIHSLIHLTLTLNKVSRPHCHVLSTKKHVVPCKFRVFKKNSRQKPITCRTLYHSSLQKTFYILELFFHVSSHYLKLFILNKYFEFLTNQRPLMAQVIRPWAINPNGNNEVRNLQ